jgi:tetratricopeptide (TPR) repeat protein
MEDSPKFDVFISHSRADADGAERIARYLRHNGLNVWFDKWSLVPGENWVAPLGEALEQTSSVAFFVGPSGFSKVQQSEFDAILSTQTSQRLPRVIPVLLPGARPETLPPFLRERPSVDLRNNLDDEHALHRLVSGIQGSDAGGEVAQEQKIGDSLRNMGDLAEAKSHYERALRLARAAYGESHPMVTDLLIRLGSVQREQGDYVTAAATLQEAFEIGGRVYGPDSPSMSSIMNNLGIVLRDLGRLEEAGTYFSRALAIDQINFGPDHPNVAIRLNNLASLLQDTGRLAEAEPLMRRALAIDEKNFGPDHPNVAIRLNNLASLLQDTGRLAETPNC